MSVAPHVLRQSQMIIPADGDADLFTLLLRLPGCIRSCQTYHSPAMLPMKLLSIHNALCSAIGNSYE